MSGHLEQNSTIKVCLKGSNIDFEILKIMISNRPRFFSNKCIIDSNKLISLPKCTIHINGTLVVIFKIINENID